MIRIVTADAAKSTNDLNGGCQGCQVEAGLGEEAVDEASPGDFRAVIGIAPLTPNN
jgi:hypothetical protein